MSSKLDFLIPLPKHLQRSGADRSSPEGGLTSSSSPHSGSADDALWDDVADLTRSVRTLSAQQKRTDESVSTLRTLHQEHCELLNSLCTDLGDYLQMESASSPTLLKSLTCALQQRHQTRTVTMSSRPPPSPAPRTVAPEPAPAASTPPPPPPPAPAAPAPPQIVVVSAPPPPPLPTPQPTPAAVVVPDETANEALALARQNKAAVERLETELSQQKTAARTQLTELEDRLSHQVDGVRRHLDAQLSRLEQDFDARLVSLHDGDKATLAQLREEVDDRIRRVEQSTSTALQAVIADVKSLQRAIPDRVREHSTELVQPLQAELSSIRRRAGELEVRVADLSRVPPPVIPDWAPQIDQLASRLQRMELALDNTRDEHEAATQKSSEREKRYLHLHAEVDRLTTALEIHTEAINDMQNRASLEGPFNEVKDWLLDLEKRVMTRGEMLEVTERFDAELADVRLDLTKRTQSA